MIATATTREGGGRIQPVPLGGGHKDQDIQLARPKDGGAHRPGLGGNPARGRELLLSFHLQSELDRKL